MKSINVFKNEQREILHVTGENTGCKITKIDSVNGDIIVDIAGVSKTFKIHGFGVARRVVDAYAIVSTIGHANNVLIARNSSTATASMFAVDTASAQRKHSVRTINRAECIIPAGGYIHLTASGTTPKKLRATLVIKTIPA